VLIREADEGGPIERRVPKGGRSRVTAEGRTCCNERRPFARQETVGKQSRVRGVLQTRFSQTALPVGTAGSARQPVRQFAHFGEGVLYARKHVRKAASRLQSDFLKRRPAVNGLQHPTLRLACFG